MIFSLIVATKGRYTELHHLLESLIIQDFPLTEFEVIIVDQNTDLDLSQLILKFSDKLNIEHIRSLKIGLSRNRNIGIRLAKGQFFAFPDDDCTYYSNTLSSAFQFLSSHPAIDVAIGRLYDRNKNLNLYRDWPTKSRRLHVLNFMFMFTAVTIFLRRNEFYFDEQLGVGTTFGSYEDADFLLRIIRDGHLVMFSPDIDVWHPPWILGELPTAKIFSYGLGFGGFVRKNFSPIICGIFLAAIAYHFLNSVRYLFLIDLPRSKRSFVSMISRLQGLLTFRPNRP